MRVRVFAALMMLLATLAVVPGRAQVPMLRCEWSGVLHVDSDFSFEVILWSLGPGSGRCIGDGAGPHDVTFTSAFGSQAVQFFDFSVRFKLHSQSTGAVRSFRQHWGGLYTGCSVSRYEVSKPSNLPVGTGNLKYCGPLWPDVPPTPVDVPVSMTWSFVSAL